MSASSIHVIGGGEGSSGKETGGFTGLQMASSSLDTEQTVDSGEVIRIAVVPVSHTSPARFARYLSLIQELSVIELNTLMPDRLNIPDFHGQLWRTGRLKFRFSHHPAASEWESFQPHKRVLGVIGVLDCHECPSVNQAARQFTSMIAANFPSAMAYRCLAFDPTPDQENLDAESASFFSLIPNAPSREATLLYVNELISFFAYSLLKAFRELLFLPQELEKRVGAYIHTPLDPCREADDISRLKRRRAPRLLKLRGDFALLACAPADASQYYTQALESLRAMSDHVWIAGATEGLAAATLSLVRHGSHPSFPSESAPELHQYVLDRHLEALSIYSRRQAPVLEIECRLKLARYYWGLNDRVKALDHLSLAADLSRPSLSPLDSLAVISAVGVTCSYLRFRRKSCFFLREAAHIAYALHDYHAAHQLLIRAACALHLQDVFQDLPFSTSIPSSSSLSSSSTSSFSSLSSSTRRSGWIPLQKLVLAELIEVSKQLRDLHSSVVYLCYMLRHFVGHLSPEAQTTLAAELLSITAELPSTQWPNVDMTGAPFLIGGIPQPLKEELQPHATKAAEPGEKSIFIFNPYENRNKVGPAIVWTVGQECMVNVLLNNPLSIPLDLDMIEPYVEGVPVHTSALSLRLLPSALGLSSAPTLSNTQGITELSLSITPRRPGKLRILGCIIRAFQIDSIHLFPAEPEISLTVVEELPLLHISVPRPLNSLQLVYPGQLLQLSARIQNLSNLPSHWMEASATSEETDLGTHTHLLPPLIQVVLPASRVIVAPRVASVPITIRCRKSNIKAAVHIEYGMEGSAWKRQASYYVRQQVISGLSVSQISLRPTTTSLATSTCNMIIHLRNEASVSFEVSAQWAHPDSPLIQKDVVVTSQERLLFLQIPRFSLSEAQMDTIISAKPDRQFVKQNLTEEEKRHVRRAFCYKAAIMQHLKLEWHERPNRSRGIVVGLHELPQLTPLMLSILEPCPISIEPLLPEPLDPYPAYTSMPISVRISNTSSHPLPQLYLSITPLRLSHPESPQTTLNEVASTGALASSLQLDPSASVQHSVSLCFMTSGRFTIQIVIQTPDQMLYYHKTPAINVFFP